MTHDVNLGIGNETGMAYHAPAGTALPAYPGAELDAAWKEIGAVSEDGISYGMNHSFDTLRNWAKQIERLMAADGDATVTAPFIDTTESTLKTLFGEDNVTVTDATQDHGKLISVEIGPDTQTDAEAFLFLMKDGDDMIMIGTPRGFITEVGDIDFAPNDAITWEATISSKSWTVTKDNGQTL
jgi:hypothetical protein